MPEMYLRQTGFTDSSCEPLKKNKERIQKFEETVDWLYIYQKELHKAWHDMAFGDYKDLTRRTASDKTLRDKAFNIAKDTKYDVYQRGFASIVYKSFW